MLYRQMKYFVSVVEKNSFTEAAEDFYISQSAVSQQIQLLEEDLGVPLLVRGNRKFRLTPAGEYFYRQSVLLLDEINRIRHETIQIGTKEQTRLRIGFQKSYPGAELQKAVAAFVKKYPDVFLQVTNGTHEELSKLLYDGAIDISINDHRRSFSNLYQKQLLYTSFTHVALSQQSPLCRFPYISMNDLRHVPCILVSSKEQRNNEQEYFQNALGFRGTFIWVDNSDEAHLMVLANSGFLLTEDTSSVLDDEAGIHKILLFRDGKLVSHEYYAFWKKEAINSFLNVFLDDLMASFSHQDRFSKDVKVQTAK